jgi:hypothetical protein
MAERWVLPWLFNAQAASVNWEAERERRHYDGPVLETEEEAGEVQLRWLLHPVLGLPLAPFTVWRLPFPAGALSDQELANLPDWEPLEIAGLPVNASWAGTGYPTAEQGPLAAPLSPVDAARRRLVVGAPRIGWDALQVDGAVLPEWEPSDLHTYLDELLAGRLLAGVRAMLVARPDPLTHAAYVETIVEGGALQLRPRLMGSLSDHVGVPDRPATAEWRPLGLLAVGAGSDALASLALGFGTAVEHIGVDDAAYMVSVPHRLALNGQEFAFELAAVVRLDRQPGPPDPPAGLTAASMVRNRPEETDGPYRETVGVSWERPPHPRFSGQPSSAPYPASYAVGAFGPGARRAAILLTRRSDVVRGWLPFVASLPDAVQPDPAPEIRFADHLSLTTTVAGQFIPDVLPDGYTYGVAAQDLFGRWSAWSTVTFEPEREATQNATLLAVRLDHGGTLEVDFAWDWSDRSPQFVELSGAFADDPGSDLLAARLSFAGHPEPPPLMDMELIPLDPDRAEITAWGTAQDRPGEEPAWRFYRLRKAVSLAFTGQRSQSFAVSARGQRHLHEAFIPGFNISPFGPPLATTVNNPAPPPFQLPITPEIPQWASLPDAAGVSRAVLSWASDPAVAGYALYEATETALLSALGLPGPDTAASLIDRLAVLRSADLPAQRTVFRRLREELISPQGQQTSYEVALPRGSAVLHFYALTALSPNQMESCWPADTKQFIAVATPRLNLPAEPFVEAAADPAAAPPQVHVRLWPGRGAAPSRIELFRTANELLAGDADAMGPPIATIEVNGAELAFDDKAAPAGWRRLWYRAVAWTADDPQAGLVGGRSPASGAAAVLLPPSNPPAIVNLRVNQEGSTDAESLLSWESEVPMAVTPLGPHTTALETTDAAGIVVIRLSGRVDALATIPSPSDLLPPDPAQRAILRYGGNGAAPRFYAWVPRPAPDQPFHATVTMIDPLGRVGRAEADVPPMPPGPRLGPVAITPLAPPHFPPPRRFSVSWEIPMAIPTDQLGQYTLMVQVVMELGPGGFAVQRTLAQVPEIAEPSQFNPFRQIARLAGQPTYFMFLRTSPRPAEAIVTLTDPLGRSVQQTGTFG